MGGPFVLGGIHECEAVDFTKWRTASQGQGKAKDPASQATIAFPPRSLYAEAVSHNESKDGSPARWGVAP